MGTMNHNAVVATTWKPEAFAAVKEWIGSLAQSQAKLFAFTDEVTNGYRTVVMVPDGSKEGWDESDRGDALRNDFIVRLESARYSDESSPWSWVEVGYGEYGQKILRGNNENCFNDLPYARRS